MFFEEEFEIRNARLFQFEENRFGKENRMPSSAIEPRLADFVWICSRKFEQRSEGAGLHLRLVAQENYPMSKLGPPAFPLRGRLDRTEHSTIRRWIKD